MFTRLLSVAACLLTAVAVLVARPYADFELTSPGFAANQAIPADNSCDGANTSPALHWSGAPPATLSFALIVNDPDAPRGGFVHWVAYDLAPTLSSLPAAPSGTDISGATSGSNGFGKRGYGGPCPPVGAPHHYVFTLYALSSQSVGLPAGASASDVQTAMKGKILAQAQLVGLYSRRH